MNDLATVSSFRDLLDAQAAFSKLEDEGFECSPTNEYVVGVAWTYSVAVGGVQRQVAADHAGDGFSSIDELIREVISGPAGPRDWDRERTLFYQGARLMPAGRGPAGGAGGEIFDMEGYIASRSPFFGSSAFYEVETAHRTFSATRRTPYLSTKGGIRPTASRSCAASTASSSSMTAGGGGSRASCGTTSGGTIRCPR